MARSSLKNIVNLVDALKEDLPVEQSFLNDLTRSIELTDEKNSRPGSKAYKPSGMNCIRQSYYVLTGAQADEHSSNSTIVGICESGSDRHERIQQAVLDMKANDMDCEYINVADFVRQRGLDEYLDIVKEPDFSKQEYETKLYHKSLNMSFLCDGIIRYQGKYFILELKTESAYKFISRKGVDEKHYNQGISYSIAFGLDEVIFVYISRDVLDMKAYLFKPTAEQKQDLLGRISTCDTYVNQGKIPPKPDNAGPKLCSYCAYKTRCKGDD